MPRKRSWAQKEKLRLAQEAAKKKRFLQKLQNELGAKFHPEIHDPVLGAQFNWFYSVNFNSSVQNLP